MYFSHYFEIKPQKGIKIKMDAKTCEFELQKWKDLAEIQLITIVVLCALLILVIGIAVILKCRKNNQNDRNCSKFSFTYEMPEFQRRFEQRTNSHF